MDAGRWGAALETFLIPALPPGWQAAGGALVREPVGWTAALVEPAGSRGDDPDFKIQVVVQFLANGDPGGFTCSTQLDGVVVEADSVAGYAPVMTALADRIQAGAVPFLDRYSGLPGYLRHLRERVAQGERRGLDSPDMTVCEELTYVHLLSGEREAADAAAEQAERTGARNRARPAPKPWVDEALARIRAVMAADPDEARVMLTRNARRAARRLKLPAPRV